MTAAADNGRGRRRLPPRQVLANVRWLLLDVDGVLTDGSLWFDHEGREYKSFHVHDAAGIVYWHRAGNFSGFLSGRGGDVVERRARELGVHEVLLGRIDKAAAFAELLARRAITADQVAYVGDDLLDLPVLRQVAFAATVPAGRAEVRAAVHYVTKAQGGHGAARDVVELLLAARGAWAGIVARGGLP
jgi:3-deoxy-D-manno-octulosonate 8-phosphate phosphatase (KDO 8-P phosphatase)